MHYIRLILLLLSCYSCAYASDLELSLTDSPIKQPIYLGSHAVQNCALIGAGRQGTRLLNAAKENDVKVHVIYSRTIANAEKLAAADKLPVTYDIQAAICRDDIDSVAICTPDFMHYEHAVMALKAGKHVFLEKPVASNLEQAKALVEVAHEKKLCLAVGYHMRWSIALRYMHDAISRKEYGRIHSASIAWKLTPHVTDDWRNNTNPWWLLSVMGTHCIDIALWLFDDHCGPMEEFSGVKNNQTYQRTNEDSIELKFLFGETPVTITCAFSEESSDLKVVLNTDTGEYVGCPVVGPGQEIRHGESVQKFSYKNPWQAAFKDFKEAVAEQRAPYVSLSQAIRNIELMEQVKRADDWVERK